jgi:hypothetical protein
MRRLLLVVVALALSAFLAPAASAPAAKAECPPDAPPTFNCVIFVDDDFVDEEVCDFDVRIRVIGRYQYAPRHDRDGNLIGEAFMPNLKITVTNVDTGRSFTDRDVGLDKATFNEDGTIDVLSTGLHFKVRTDDNKTVFRRIGLQIIHFDADGKETIEIVGGNFQPIEEFEEAFCSYLSG